jgi:prepilin-type N-terminal cleavage/methylation domain-containing protein
VKKGFTLLEVVVAVAVLGVSVGLAMQIFSGGLKNIHRIQQAHRAMNHAENVMNEILTDASVIGPMDLSGDLDEDFSYTAQIDYWDPPEEEGLRLEIAQTPIEILSVVVDIHFKDDRYGKKYRAVCLKSFSLQQVPGAMAPVVDPIQQLFGTP